MYVLTLKHCVMSNLKKPSNEEKMEFLLMVLNENKQQDKKSQYLLYYSIYLIRFGAKVPVVIKEPSTVDIKEQIMKYATKEAFNPDFIVVDIFSAKSRNAKLIATYKFDYKSKVN